MSTFDQRKDAFENKFAHDEELRFKATARRNKLLGAVGGGEARRKPALTPMPMPKSGRAGRFRGGRRRGRAAQGQGRFRRRPASRSPTSEIRQVMNSLLLKAAEDIQAGR